IGPGPVTSAESVGRATAVGDAGRFACGGGGPPRPRPPPGPPGNWPPPWTPPICPFSVAATRTVTAPVTSAFRIPPICMPSLPWKLPRRSLSRLTVRRAFESDGVILEASDAIDGQHGGQNRNPRPDQRRLRNRVVADQYVSDGPADAEAQHADHRPQPVIGVPGPPVGRERQPLFDQQTPLFEPKLLLLLLDARPSLDRRWRRRDPLFDHAHPLLVAHLRRAEEPEEQEHSANETQRRDDRSRHGDGPGYRHK